MLTSALEPRSCFKRRCVPVWLGLCPQSSQISLLLISTLQKSCLAYLQQNEATNCRNQPLIVRARLLRCVRKHGLRVPVHSVCGLIASFHLPIKYSHSVLEQRSGSFLFPLLLFFTQRVFQFSPPIILPLSSVPLLCLQLWSPTSRVARRRECRVLHRSAAVARVLARSLRLPACCSTAPAAPGKALTLHFTALTVVLASGCLLDDDWALTPPPPHRPAFV